METTHLSAKDSHTMAKIFQHPASHNLEWRDVIGLIEHLGTVEEKDSGRLSFTVNGVSEVFHRSSEKDISTTQEVLDLRHFIEKSGVTETEGVGAASGLRLVVVVSHQETLVYRSEIKGAVPERLSPYDPHGYLRHLHHATGDDAGSRAPEDPAYYSKIAETLTGADEILLMGNGSGGSSAMNHLTDFLRTHHHLTADKIVGSVTVDLEAMTEGEILKEARAFYSAPHTVNEAVGAA